MKCAQDCARDLFRKVLCVNKSRRVCIIMRCICLGSRHLHCVIVSNVRSAVFQSVNAVAMTVNSHHFQFFF